MRLLDDAGQVAVEIMGLRFDQLGHDARHAAQENLDDWLYEFQWQSKERPAPEPPERSVSQSSAPASSGPWLIFADGGGVGEALAALLRAQGETSILVSRGESYERTDGEHFRIHPERPEDLRQLLRGGHAICSVHLPRDYPSLES